MASSNPHSHSESAREREFYRYFHHADFANIPRYADSIVHHPHSPYGLDAGVPFQNLPRSSEDRALTAFAQLGALRLDARRCMISFFDRRHTYLLAEATRTLSLETDTSRHHEDDLWWGTRIFPKGCGVHEHMVNMPALYEDPLEAEFRIIDRMATRSDVTILVIPDLAADARFMKKPYVVGKPNARFYAGVPIRSPAGHSIGAYCVLDDKPRLRGVTKDERDFMVDMAVTVMKHLEMTKAKDELRRGSRMVRGLGSFVEGRESINDWWIVDGSEPPATSPDANALAGPPSTTASQNLREDRPDLRRNPLSFEGERARLLIEDNSNQHAEAVSATNADNDFETPKLAASIVTTETLDKAASELQEVILAPDVKSTFNRAAKIIREATEVDGAIFFDASVGTFGGLVDETDPMNGEWSPQQAFAGEQTPAMNISQNRLSFSGRWSSHSRSQKECGILGSSLHPLSQSLGARLAITETFLQELLQRYPRGRIFTFDEDSPAPYLPANEEPFSMSANATSPTVSVVHADAQRLRLIFPHAHALALCPLWDSHRMRWFAASVIWSTDSMRIFNTDTELSYLSAFGNSVMADVARLDAKMADKVKGDFISSISHELRSPLHGILGSVELLREMELGKNEDVLVGTVEVCGRTLLDTIEHVLDFAKINKVTKSSTKGSPMGTDGTSVADSEVTLNENSNPLMGLTTEFDLSLLAEEVIETVYAGYGFKKPNISGDLSDIPAPGETYHQLSAMSEKEVSVVVDIIHSNNWAFKTQPGAWRRILMNLFGNALKYTDKGFVRVRLQARPISSYEDSNGRHFSPASHCMSRVSSMDTDTPPDLTQGMEPESEVILTVTDSGKGMSPTYQRERLFHAFAQEDPLAPGTGLGLSITRQLVQDLGGKIEIASERGHGTQISVMCRLKHANAEKVHSLQAGNNRINLREARDRAREASIYFIGFDADTARPSTIHNPLANQTCPMTPTAAPNTPVNATASLKPLVKASFRRMFANWLGSRIIHGSRENEETPIASIYIVSQGAIDRITSLPNDSAVIVMCPGSARVRVMRSIDTFGTDRVIEVVTKPCGPRKAALAVVTCLDRLEARRARLSRADPKITNSIDRCFSVDSGLCGLSNLPVRSNMAQILGSNPTESNLSSISMFEVTPERDDGISKTPGVTVNVVEQSDDSKDQLGAEQKTEEPSRPRVLCVDDNSVNLHLLVAYMKKARLDYGTATNGLEAVEVYKAADGGFDFVLMDISMPILDGLAATRQIRAWERERGLSPATVVALTGLASASAQQEALGSGVDLFQTKPAKFQDLLRLLGSDVDGR